MKNNIKSNILLIGSGAREHAIAKAISSSKSDFSLICLATAKNPGILQICDKLIECDICDAKSVCEHAKEYDIDLAVCGPEAPLAKGVMDALKAIDIKTVGPTKALAQLESSKGFTRDLWDKHNIDAQPLFQRFDDEHNLIDLLERMHPNYVVKADGLMGGKGVKVFGEHLDTNEDALNYCKEIFQKGQGLVIEEKLVGVEFSLISLTDGKSFVHLPVVQDHKRAYDGDTGPNTGGMGTYSDVDGLLPFLSEDDVKAAQILNERTIDAVQKDVAENFCGFLYGGFMLTKSGVKLIEYNVRFGDPEAINLVPLIDTDWVKLLNAMAEQKLDSIKDDIKIKNRATVCQYVVPKGYPDAPKKGPIIVDNLSDDLIKDNLFIGAVALDEDGSSWVMTGSRAIGVLGVGGDLPEAHAQACGIISHISGDIFYRKDIGTADLISKRVDFVKGFK